MRKFDKKLATVVTVGGEHFVMMPSGESLPCVLTTNVKCSVGETAEVTLTARVNLAESVKGALEMYNENKIEMVAQVDGTMIKRILR